MKYSVFGLAFVSVLVLMSTLVSAEIFISQPSSLYNIGDDFSVNIIVNKNVNTNDFFISKLICDESEVELFRSPFYVSGGQNRNISLNARLDRSLIGDSTGSCYIQAQFSDETVKSQTFEITDRINVNLIVKNAILDPEQQVVVTGTAKKANGQKVEGFAEISVPDINLSQFTNVVSGDFSFNLTIPSNTRAGSYNLRSRVYERETSGETTNEGYSSSQIRINQLLKGISISLASESVKPGENFSYIVNSFDQSNYPVNTDINSIISTSAEINSVFSRKLVKASTGNIIYIPKNATPGKWTVEAFIKSFADYRQFMVEVNKEATFVIENGTLSIVNVGNVPYDIPLKIEVGESSFLTDNISPLNISVGSEKRFLIKVPKEGEYPINIYEGNRIYNFSSQYISHTDKQGFGITGASISLVDLENMPSSKLNSIIWILVIVFLILISTYYYLKVRRGHFVARAPKQSDFPVKMSNRPKPAMSPTTSKEKVISFIPQYQESIEAKKKVPLYQRTFESSVSDRTTMNKPVIRSPTFETYNPDDDSRSTSGSGATKEEVVVVALKIKNAQRLKASESTAFMTIEHAMSKARNLKAKVYDQGDFKVLVFSQRLSPKITSVEAIKAALEIERMLKDFNKKFAIKIEYGLGANLGTMFFEIVDGKAKFTSVGNTLILAKNSADKANLELLVSQPLYRKIYSVVKGDATQFGLYKVNSLVDRAQHSDFIKKFMKGSKDQSK